MSDTTLLAEATAALVTPVDDYLTINPETLEIDVPESELIFGVYSDNNAAKKLFKCPRYVQNNIDLSTCTIYVNYLSVTGMLGQANCVDISVTDDEDYVTFAWLLRGFWGVMCLMLMKMALSISRFRP